MVFIALLLIQFCAQGRPATGLIAAFMAGVIVDLWYGLTLGASALAYLIIAFTINWYKNKFNATNNIFLYFFSVLSGTALLVIQQNELTVSLIVTMIVAVSVISYVWKYFGAKAKKSY